MRAAPAKRKDSPEPTSPWAARRRVRNGHALKRDAVILAAARAFRERGYHNTSLDDLAASLKVTKPTLYLYVPGKEAILFECFRAGIAPILATLDDCETGAGPARDRLFAFIRGYAAAIVGDFGWCMLRAEDQHLGAGMSRRIKLLKAGIDKRMRALIEAGVADGSIRACDTKMTAFALAGALNWMGHWYREDASLKPAEIADRFIDVFNRGLRGRD
ncbi:MAG TPA: TetR/AcrR family transcriptional regulator [Steroidobacteraceae bacterium]|jgi:AcrR family transcriptional regulator|nr:TetR/AcrR family transcriptional regulator [Steroidobacteraceae bacterium]